MPKIVSRTAIIIVTCLSATKNLRISCVVGKKKGRLPFRCMPEFSDGQNSVCVQCKQSNRIKLVHHVAQLPGGGKFQPGFQLHLNTDRRLEVLPHPTDDLPGLLLGPGTPGTRRTTT